MRTFSAFTKFTCQIYSFVIDKPVTALGDKYLQSTHTVSNTPQLVQSSVARLRSRHLSNHVSSLTIAPTRHWQTTDYSRSQEVESERRVLIPNRLPGKIAWRPSNVQKKGSWKNGSLVCLPVALFCERHDHRQYRTLVRGPPEKSWVD